MITYPEWVDDSLIQMTDNSRQVFTDRYLRKDENGTPIETIAQAIYRVCSNVANPLGLTESYYNMISNFDFVPNSPTFTGAGTPLGQLAACFVLPVEDDMNGIFETLQTAALIQQSGGGVGFSFSRLRSRGTTVSRSMGQATGPVGFMRVYDAAFGEIAQGGTRRGANMAVLRVDHPDIEEFIDCKLEEGELTNFNVSVAVTDHFMNSVMDDNTWDLIDPHTKKIVKTVKARELFLKIATNAHRNGEPGVLFIDRANGDNPVPGLYELEATNPCGEQWLGPYENCCLGSINLANHVTDDDKIDWEKLIDTVELATEFLDDVITANKYIPAVPEICDAALATRRIGLGIMGLADMFYKVGVRYGSVEAQELTKSIMELIRWHSMETSMCLAAELGPFPAIASSIYDDWRWEDHLPEFTQHPARTWDRPPVDWDWLQEEINKNGIRNATTLTVAPTGTIATVAGCEGYGCEPVFALGYIRNVKDVDTSLTGQLQYYSELFSKRTHLSKYAWEDILYTGSCQGVEGVPQEYQDVFVVSQDITPEEHIMMQSATQMFVDNSISKTCNLPAEATVGDVWRAYTIAWFNNCKGVTVYVQGSRDEVVLATAETQDSASCFKCPNCGYGDCG